MASRVQQRRELLDERRAGQHRRAAGHERPRLEVLLDVRAVADDGRVRMGSPQLAHHRHRIAARQIQIDEHAAPLLSGTQGRVSIRGDGERGPQLRSSRLELRSEHQIIHNSENHPRFFPSPLFAMPSLSPEFPPLVFSIFSSEE